MSTVDLTKVAGFKAVDAEGNDLGIVSLQDMTNMVKESIVQEAVAMQSVPTLAEASTLAATDTYEDKLDISDTFSYVRTLDSSGNPKRTSQNALATVVGELLSNKGDLTSSLLPSGMYLNKYFNGFSESSILLIELNLSGSNSLRLSCGYPMNQLLVDVLMSTKTGGDSGKPHVLYVKRVLGSISQLESAIAYYDKSKNKAIIEMTLTQNLYTTISVFCYSSNCNDIKCVQTSEYDTNNDTNLVNATIS